MKTIDKYSPTNLTRYQIALAVVDKLQAEGFLQEGDKEKIYAIIAKKYSIDINGIYAP